MARLPLLLWVGITTQRGLKSVLSKITDGAISSPAFLPSLNDPNGAISDFGDVVIGQSASFRTATM